MGSLATNAALKQIPICGCCGGPRSKFSAAWCKDCYRKDTRPTQFNPVSLPVNWEQVTIVLAEIAARDERDRKREEERPLLEARRRLKLERRIQTRIHKTRNALSSSEALPYPYLRVVRDDHADLMAVNSIVPRGMEGREDVCQEVMIALWENRISIADLRANKESIRGFLAAFRRDNLEDRGYAVSLDEPLSGGGSWHDTLVDPNTVDAS